MIIYSFDGFYNGGNSQDFVSIDYDEVNDVLSAVTSVGATARFGYDTVSPAKADGDEIWRSIINGNTVSIKWYQYYPFATSSIVEDPDPPVEVITINSIVVTPQSAPAVNDGTATVNASGGTGPYQYSMNGVDYQSGNVFTGLMPGTYSVFVKSAVNPATSGTFTIAAAPYPEPVDEPAIKDVIVEEGAEISIQNAYKRVEVLSEFGKVPSLLYNGDFEAWDGQNFNFWTRYGGMGFSRVQRTVTNTNGATIPIENWAIQFDVKADSGKWLESAPIPIQKGDTAKVQYRVSKITDVTEYSYIETRYLGPAPYPVKHDIKTFYAAKIRFKIGNYYLYNENYGSSYVWTTNLAPVSNPVSNKDGDINTYAFTFQIPECPETGNMVIQLYGFEKVMMDSWESPIQSEGSGTNYTVLSEYSPVTMDDISLSKSSQSGDNDVTGLLSVSENLRYYTEKPDQVKILFGDYFNSAAGAGALSNLYAMKVGNGYSAGWYEYGTTNSPVAFGLALAKSILRAYQKPFRFWIGKLKLKPMAPEFNYLNVLSFDVPGQDKFSSKLFTILGGDIDLKYNTIENVKLAEIFDKPAKSNDVTVPNYPGTTPPVFVQDPNGGDANGIFTDEFTLEFS